MVTLFTGAAQLVTCTTTDDSAVLENAALAIEDRRILDIGPIDEITARYERADRVDCSSAVITPGFIDSHTHAVFGGMRSYEYALRSRGVPYMEIARRGGGILASVRDVRSMSEDELLMRTRERVVEMFAQGTTTVEIKSGYGLETNAELKQLRVVRTLRDEGFDVIPTFLGAHEVPPEYRDRRDEYMALLIDDMIPRIAHEGLARFCDVFCEPGVFTPEETRRILEAGKAHGLIPKLHADELENSGAAEVAAAVGAASADHLAAISEDGIRALATSGTVATLLPTTMLFLGKTKYAPARRMIDAGVRVALATDFNPGSSPTHDMRIVLTLACSQMGMDPLEAIVAATAGGAAALQLDSRCGTLQPGALADLVVWRVPDYAEIPYRFGAAPIERVYKAGRQLFPSL